MEQKEIQIVFTPIFCSLVGEVEEEIQKLLYENLSFRPTGYFFSPKYQNKLWDGYSRLFNYTKNQFRSGLLTRVVKILENNNYKVKVLNKPQGRKFEWGEFNAEKREYQFKINSRICEKRFGIIKAPPRTGKTVCVAGVLGFERSFPAIIYCRSLDLCMQTVKRIAEILPSLKVGFIADGEINIGDITVITIQSAYSAYNKEYEERGLKKEREILKKVEVKELISSAKTIFYDESHHSSSRTSRFILEKSPNVEMKIGLSATPFAGEPEDLLTEETLGPVIYDVGYSELIKEGFLLRPIVYMYKLPKINVEGSYRQVYKEAVVNNEFLYKLIKRIKERLVSLNKSLVIQTDLINHTKELGKYLGCDILTGQERDISRRKELLEKLQNKEILCLVSTVVDEGIDLPSLDYSCNVAGGLSNISTLQRMRSITANKGKTTCGIIDFYHQCKYLQRHSKVRLKAYKSESEFKVIERDVSQLKELI